MKLQFSSPATVQLAPPTVSSVLCQIATVDFDAKTVSVSLDDGSGRTRHVMFPLPTPPYDLAVYVGQQLGALLGVTVTESATIQTGP